MFMGANGALVKEQSSLGFRLYALLDKMFTGVNGALVKERFSLGLRLYAQLVECLRVQIVVLSRSGFHLTFECLLN